jgi:hypothetical protein
MNILETIMCWENGKKHDSLVFMFIPLIFCAAVIGIVYFIGETLNSKRRKLLR